MSESQLRKSPRELRDELEALIRDDLIGPIGGAEEELPEAPVDRYVLGMLAPRFRFGSPPPAPPAGGGDEDDDSIAFDALPEDDLADGGIMADEGEDGRAEDRPPALDQLVPSAFGLTFALDERLPGAACPGVVGRVLEGDERAVARSRRQAAARLASAPVRRRRDDQDRWTGCARPRSRPIRPSRRWWFAGSCATAAGSGWCRCFSSTGSSRTVAGRCRGGCARRR